MYLNHTCPRCAQPIQPEKMGAKTVICDCGWSGDKSVFDPPKRTIPYKKIGYALVILAIGFVFHKGQKWGKHLPETAWHSVLTTLKMTSAKDEARMATVCKKVNDHKCAAEAYTKALAKSPQSKQIAGALGVELAKIGQHDRAILTFQNFFSSDEGDHDHKRYFAKALSDGGYTDDATEWYYQALRQQSDYFDAAKDLIHHLVKSDNYTEALSVIGHYNTLYPKTIKDWANMTTEVKDKYQSYSSQYQVTEFKISGLSKYLHAPVKMANSTETQIFLVDPESQYLTVDMKYLNDHGISYTDKGQKEVTATNGKSLKGTEVILPTLTVGTFELKNVKALACENCAFLLGKTVMKQLNAKPKTAKGVKYITLKK